MCRVVEAARTGPEGAPTSTTTVSAARLSVKGTGSGLAVSTAASTEGAFQACDDVVPPNSCRDDRTTAEFSRIGSLAGVAVRLARPVPPSPGAPVVQVPGERDDRWPLNKLAQQRFGRWAGRASLGGERPRTTAYRAVRATGVMPVAGWRKLPASLPAWLLCQSRIGPVKTLQAAAASACDRAQTQAQRV
jgi:hypothetical protein